MPPASRFETGNAALSSSRISSPQRPRQATRTRPQAQGQQGQVPRHDGGARHRTGREERTPAAPPPVGPGEHPAWKAIVASKRRDVARNRSRGARAASPQYTKTDFASKRRGFARKRSHKKRRPRTTTSRPPSRRTSRRAPRRDDSSSRPTTPCPPTGARRARDTCGGGSSVQWWAWTASSSRN